MRKANATSSILGRMTASSETNGIVRYLGLQRREKRAGDDQFGREADRVAERCHGLRSKEIEREILPAEHLDVLRTPHSKPELERGRPRTERIWTRTFGGNSRSPGSRNSTDSAFIGRQYCHLSLYIRVTTLFDKSPDEWQKGPSLRLRTESWAQRHLHPRSLLKVVFPLTMVVTTGKPTFQCSRHPVVR